MAIKGQALADFIAEFTYANTAKLAGTANIVEAAKVVEAQGEKNFVLVKWDAEQWTLYMDEIFNDTGSKAGIMLIIPEWHKIHCALRFEFKASNKKTECEALNAGLRLAKELQARSIN